MKRLIVMVACAALTTLVAAPAFAAEPVTVKLAQPVAQPMKFVAGGAVFNCAADACVASATTSETFALATCKVVAGKVGPLLAFAGTRPMDAARLGVCNTAVKGGAQLAKQ